MRESPWKRLTTGERIIRGDGHTPPTMPRSYGTGVPVLGDTPRDRNGRVQAQARGPTVGAAP
jgi:hypothetical protein